MKTLLPKNGFLALCALLACRLSGAPSEWSFGLAPYLWVPKVSIDSSLPDLPPGTPPETKRFATKLTGALLLAGRVQHGEFGFVVDYDWLRLDTAANQPGPAFSAVELSTNLAHATTMLTWRMPTDGVWRVELLAGARFWWVDVEQKFQSGVLPGFTRQRDQTWVDPTFGLDVSYALGDHWSLLGKTRLGGFGSGSKTMVEALVGAGYRFDGGNSAFFGYRYLYEDFKRDDFTWDLSAQGFLVGYNFSF